MEVKKRYADADLDKFKLLSSEHKRVVNYLKDCFANGFTRNVAIIGPSGIGKTYIAYCIVKHFSKEKSCKLKGSNETYKYYQSDKVYYTKCQDLLSNIKKNIGGVSAVISDDIKDYPLLILDGFSSSEYSSFELGELFSIVDYRFEKELPTIILSGIPMPKIKAIIGERMSMRLFKDCDVFTIMDNGGNK